jgi:AAA15 family ATPase/GTPase
MEHFFHTVRITNFKSLKDVTLSDCKRINLLIGKPNVGKSNILEAIGLFSLPYLKYNGNENQKITQFVRVENIPELFFDGNIDEKITISTDDNSLCTISYLERHGLVDFEIHLKNQLDSRFDSIAPIFLTEGDQYTVSINNQLNVDAVIPGISDDVYPFPPKVKFYKFYQDHIFKKSEFFIRHLLPPCGINLFDVIQNHKELKKDLSSIFSGYGLKLLFDNSNHTLRLMKSLKDDNIISFPYSSIADTLQRVIFFKATIASNKNSILLFEEPEAHCFPPYITHIAREIIDSESNQFFIATHSPYILDTFLEKDRDDLAIYMADFKDGQTVIKRLTDAELNDVYEYGLDLFFNAELFTDEI